MISLLPLARHSLVARDVECNIYINPRFTNLWMPETDDLSFSLVLMSLSTGLDTSSLSANHMCVLLEEGVLGRQTNEMSRDTSIYRIDLRRITSRW